MTDQPKRRGRPPVDPHERKSKNLNFRLRDDLRARLVHIAAVNSRSLSEEVGHRLAKSFDDSDIRQIIREEIAAALKPSDLPADWLSPLPKPGDPSVQLSDRDWLLGISTKPCAPVQPVNLWSKARRARATRTSVPAGE